MTMSNDEYKTVINQLMESNKIVRESNEDQKKMVSLLIKTCESQQEMMKKMFDNMLKSNNENNEANEYNDEVVEEVEDDVEEVVEEDEVVEEVEPENKDKPENKDDKYENTEDKLRKLFSKFVWKRIKYDHVRNQGYILMGTNDDDEDIYKYLDVREITGKDRWNYDMVNRYYLSKKGPNQIAITFDKFLRLVKPMLITYLTWGRKIDRKPFIDLLDSMYYTRSYVSLTFRKEINTNVLKFLQTLYGGIYDADQHLLHFTHDQYTRWAPNELVDEFYAQ